MQFLTDICDKYNEALAIEHGIFVFSTRHIHKDRDMVIFTDYFLRLSRELEDRFGFDLWYTTINVNILVGESYTY
jgi:hypothetical protein